MTTNPFGELTPEEKAELERIFGGSSTKTAANKEIIPGYQFQNLRAATWLNPYGPDNTAEGNFVDVSELEPGSDAYNAAVDAQNSQLEALFNTQGISSEVLNTPGTTSNIQFETGKQKILAGAAKEAFQTVLQTPSDAVDRDDAWGADINEGGYQNLGKSFLEDVVSGVIPEDQVTMNDLYDYGLHAGKDVGADAFRDAGGKIFWSKWMTDTGKGLGGADGVAASFLASNTAQVNDVFHEQYGRMADPEGLKYFSNDTINQGVADANGDGEISIYDNTKHVLSFIGDDVNNDGTITNQEAIDSTYLGAPSVQSETYAREMTGGILGRTSREDQREAKIQDTATHGSFNPFTAANNETIQDYVDYINKGRAEGTQQGKNAMLNVMSDIGYTGTAIDATVQGDVDDAPGGSGIGKLLTDQAAAAELKKQGVTLPTDYNQVTSQDPEDIAAFAGNIFEGIRETTWPALTKENPKDADDLNPFVTWPNTGFTTEGGHPVTHDPILDPDGNPIDPTTQPAEDDPSVTNVTPGTMTVEDAKDLMSEDAFIKWKKHTGRWNTAPQTGLGSDSYNPPSQNITPSDSYSRPDKFTANEVGVDYMKIAGSDVQDTSSYGTSRGNLTTAIDSIDSTPKQVTTQTGSRFTGGSAKGVRTKRSKQSRSGKALGTKQFNRLQIQSLNV